MLNGVLNSLRMDSNRLIRSLLLHDAYKEFDTFSCSRKKETVAKGASQSAKYIAEKGSGSLESIHNLYHALIGGNAEKLDPPYDPKDETNRFVLGGGGGHMSEVSTAAFDPIFVSVLLLLPRKPRLTAHSGCTMGEHKSAYL
jgi:hypothetical protein